MEELILVDTDEQKVLANGNSTNPIDLPKSDPQIIQNSYGMGGYTTAPET